MQHTLEAPVPKDIKALLQQLKKNRGLKVYNVNSDSVEEYIVNKV